MSEAEWADLTAENAELKKAGSVLLAKLDAIRKATDGIFLLAKIHGVEYAGPNWAEEYEALKVLSQSPAVEETVLKRYGLDTKA